MNDPAVLKIVAMALLLLALAGLANAVYFTLLSYRVLDSSSRWVPSFCRMADHTCEAVVFTRYGHLLGIPNSLPGVCFYLLIGGEAITALTSGRFQYMDAALAGCGAAVLFGVYLIYALFVRLKAP